LVQALEPLDVEPLRLGRSAVISVGERVVVAGAGGLEHAVDARVVAKQEFSGYWEYLLEEAIYTTPPHPHWAGTALISGDGGLVGVGSLYVQQVTPNATPMDVNMMIPIDLLPPIVDDLMRFGVVKRPSRPWIGMQAAEFGENLVVVGLTDNGPAEAADIRVGDVVTGVGGNPVESLGDLFRGMWGLGEAGITVPLNIFRNGQQIEINISSEDRARIYKSPKLH
jgi:S1-C subfamily serine protease